MAASIQPVYTYRLRQSAAACLARPTHAEVSLVAEETKKSIALAGRAKPRRLVLRRRPTCNCVRKSSIVRVGGGSTGVLPSSRYRCRWWPDWKKPSTTSPLPRQIIIPDRTLPGQVNARRSKGMCGRVVVPEFQRPVADCPGGDMSVKGSFDQMGFVRES